MRPHDFSYSQRQPLPQAQLQRTVTIRNDVNLKKNSLKMVADDVHPHLWHLEFSFDVTLSLSLSLSLSLTLTLTLPLP